jgi:hypothetical protein
MRGMNSKSSNNSFYIYPGILFILTFGFFAIAANYVLYFQETRHLFIFSDDYLMQYLQRPGAPLEYVARFLTQFYAFRIAGSLILALILTLPALILYRINKRTGADNPFSILLALIPGFLMIIMQANYYHMMEYNLGYLVVLLCYLLQTSGWKYGNILLIILFPLLYYLAGGYALVFLALYIVHVLASTEGNKKFVFPLLIILTTGATFLVFWKLIFLQPVQLFVLSPLPLLENRYYIAAFIVLTLYIICYPPVLSFTGRVKLNFSKKKLYPAISLALVFLLTVFALFRVYNPQNARVINLEKMVFREQWEKAIQLHEKKPSRNLIGQYFYNLALSETGQLCNRLFKGNQNFLAGSLVLPWGDIHLDRGGYFHYSIGLINEAHRWAYEEMVVYGYRPQNIRMLAKTSLITGNYEMAHKYLDILKRTIFYRKWAKEFEKLADNPSLIASHPELGEKVKLLPPNNFFIQFNEPQNNLPFILEGNPANKKAIEFYIAGLLLTKKVEIAVSNIKDLKASGYDHIPRHLEEAILIWYNSTKEFPDLGGLSVNRETLARFDQYFAAYVSNRQYPEDVIKERMRAKFEDTFWYYFHFE